MKVIRPGNAATKALIDVYDLQGNVEQDMVYLSQVYEEARQIIGITDSFQGRTDRTATSGKAKEFAAAQSAGRLESKRVMKDAAYAALFEAMFKFKLAYTDEPRPVVSNDIHGNAQYRPVYRRKSGACAVQPEPEARDERDCRHDGGGQLDGGRDG